MRDYYERFECRLCHSTTLEQVASFGRTAPANMFVERRGQSQVEYPLDVLLCQCCGHVQLRVVVNPRILFRHYVYVSGTNSNFVAHFDAYAAELARLFNPRDGQDLALDVGSNDGVLLRALRERGFSVLGVDPAEGLARDATAQGILTLPEFWTRSLARELARFSVAPKVVTANNVFAHVDDLDDFTEGVAHILSPGGAFSFEVAYLGDMMEKGLFDLVYVEHYSYHHVTPLVPFFKQHGLQLTRVERVPTHGGSIRCYVQHPGGPLESDGSVERLSAIERERGWATRAAFQAWVVRVDEQRRRVGEYVRAFVRAGGRVAGLGAPAKATTLLHHFDIGNCLEYIVDPNPLKIGRFSPGHHVPIVGEDHFRVAPPSLAVVLAWNFADGIIAKHEDYLAKGGRLLVPFPRARLVTKDGQEEL